MAGGMRRNHSKLEESFEAGRSYVVDVQVVLPQDMSHLR
jgi:hypothetical protein